jgi:hypothetical protein
MRLSSKRDRTQMNVQREKNKLISQRRKEKKFFLPFLSPYINRERTTERKKNSIERERMMNLS